MRIAYVVADDGIPIFGHKGASVHVREFVRALGSEHTVDLFCSEAGDELESLPIRSIQAAPRAPRPDISDRWLARDHRRLASVEQMKYVVDRAFRKEKYDFIYERYSLFSDVGAAMADSHGLPFLLEVNAPLIAERQRARPLPLAARAREIEVAVCRRADAIVAVSDAMAGFAVEAGAHTERVHVLPNGVDTNRFHPSVRGDRVRSELGLVDCLVVGFAGSLKPWHGVDVLIEAFTDAAQPHWRLLVVGDGPERQSLESRVEALGCGESVIFTGAVPHGAMPQYIAAMDIAVAPYRPVPNFYFSPLKLYEYLAMGKPTVAADLGQIATVIQHCENGYLVAPDDVSSLAHALARLGGDARLRARLASKAPLGVPNWQQIVRRVTAIAEAKEESRVQA